MGRYLIIGFNVCITFTTENGTDLTLSDRKNNYINNNMAICEENCNLEEYNNNIGKAICSCKTKTAFVNKISENVLDKESFLKNFADFNNIFNIKVLKCTYLIFTIKALKENFPNIILITIIAFYIICLLLFLCNYKNEINFYIDIIIYFSISPIKIFYIIKKKKNKDKEKYLSLKTNNDTINNTDNIYNIFNIKNIKFKKKIKEIKKLEKEKIKKINKDKKIIKEVSSSKLISNSKNIISKKIKDSIKVKGISKFKSMNSKNNIKKLIEIEEKKNEKYSFIIKDFKKLSENKIYEIFKKLYTKTDNELNDLTYTGALKYDHRTYFEFYLSLLKSNHLLLFSFLPKFDFNSKIIKIYLFFFNFATFFFVNALFFTDETMGKINTDGGTFNFIYNLPQIIYSSIISNFINEIIKMFALTEINFILYRNSAKYGKIILLALKLKRNFKIKFTIFFIINLILLGCFWIYLSCFGAVYHNTQMHLIKDTLISFGTSLVTPFVTFLLPGMFRIPSLKNKNRRFLYNINKILQLLLI